jgi:sugar-specific transcriptional regulator TrmB
MEVEKLRELGLSKNESLIYVYLLKKGDTTTGSIIKHTNIANSRVYSSLNSLIEKGLVTYTVQRDGKHFQAATPKKFLELEEERKRNVALLVPKLMSLQEAYAENTVSAVYEGLEGFKTAFRKIIDDCPVGGEIFILGFSEQQFSTESLRTFIANTNLKSSKKKQKLKIILDVEARETLGRDREREKYSEVRYMPRGYINPSSVDIMGDYVYIFLWEEKPFVFMLKNKRVAESFKQYFQFLWKMAK